MKLNNSILILLALSSLFSANANYVPPNSIAPAAAPISNYVSVVPTSSPSQSTPPSTPTTSHSDKPSFPRLGLGVTSLGFSAKLDHSEKSNLLTSTSTYSDLVKICDITSHPSLCTDSISHSFRGPVDPVTALKAEIQASIKVLENAIVKLKVIRKDDSTNAITIDCLDVCEESFGYAIDDLKDGLQSIISHDIDTMESVLAGALTDISTCDDAFAESGVDSPLDDLTAKMSKFASNCLAISKLLM